MANAAPGSPDERAPTVRDMLLQTARSHALTGLLVLAAFFTLYLARGFFLPVTIAIVLALLLRPLVTALQRLRIPAGISAAALLLATVGLVGFGLTSLYEPAMNWIAEAPTAMRRIESKLRQIRQPVEEVGRAAEQVERLADPEAASTPKVAISEPGLRNRLLSGAIDTVTSIVIVAFMLFFLLATGGRLLTKIAEFTHHRTGSRSSTPIVHETERLVSRYLVTITIINVCLGVAVGLALWAIGLPNPLLWGVLVGVLNYVPYLGAVVGVIVVALASLLAFDDLGRALAAPGAYIVINSIEGMLVTPLILGRRFSVDPCFVFIWLVFWSWLWGVAGALLAMPMLTILKIVSTHVEALAPVARLIGEGDESRAERLRRKLAERRHAARSDPVGSSDAREPLEPTAAKPTH